MLPLPSLNLWIDINTPLVHSTTCAIRSLEADIYCQTRNCVMHISAGNFALFAHFAFFVVQTPTT